MFALLRRSESCFLFRLYAPPDIRIYPLRLQAHPKPVTELYKPRAFQIFLWSTPAGYGDLVKGLANQKRRAIGITVMLGFLKKMSFVTHTC